MQKNLETTLFSIDFCKASDSIHKGKMEQIIQAYGLLKESVTTIMMLYENMEATVHSPDGDTEFFNIVIRVLQGDILTPQVYNLPRLHTKNINKVNKRKLFHIKKDKKVHP